MTIGNSIHTIVPTLICATDEVHTMYLYQCLRSGAYIMTRSLGTAYRIVSIEEAQEFYNRPDVDIVVDYDGELSGKEDGYWERLLEVWRVPGFDPLQPERKE